MCTGAHDFIPAAGVVKAIISFDAHGQKIANVFHIKSGAGLAVVDLDRIQAKLLDWVTVNQRTAFPPSCSTSLMTLNDESVEGGVGKEYAISPALAGTMAGTALPLNVTVAVKWSSGLTGRTRRGRTFHPQMSFNSITAQQLTTTGQTAFQVAYAALITKLAAGGTVDKLVVVSRCLNNAWRANALVTDIVGCSVDINLDSQRRRLTGRGR